MFYSDNPITDFLRHDAQQEAWLKRRPKCSCCKERIQDEQAFNVHGKWFHEECMAACLEYVDEYV